MTKRSPWLVDFVAIAVILVASLTLLDDTFDSRRYLIVGVVPLALLLALALFTRRKEHGAWTYTIVLLLAYAPVGALLALQRPGPYFFPTATTMGRVLGETITAPVQLVSTVPPVEAHGTVMLVPYAIGFLAAAPAIWMALATRAIVWPLVSLLLGLAASVLVGPLLPDMLLVRAMVITVVVVLWLGWRAQLADTATHVGGRTLTRAWAAVALVAAASLLVAALAPAGDPEDRYLLRGDGMTRDHIEQTEIVATSGERRVLLRTKGIPNGQPIRFAVLDEYDGNEWVAGDPTPDGSPLGTFRRVGSEIAPLRSGSPVTVEIRVQPAYISDWLPVVGDLTGIDLLTTNARTQHADLRFNQASGNMLVLGGVKQHDRYTLSTVVSDVELDPEAAMAEPTAAQRQPAASFLDTYFRPFDGADLQPLREVMLLAEYLRTHGSVRLGGGSSQTTLDLGVRFMGGKPIIGTPHQYAALMALGAARLGVPARLVVGGFPNRRGALWTQDVESWVELQAQDGTWRILPMETYLGTKKLPDPKPEPPTEWVKETVKKVEKDEGSGRQLDAPTREWSPWGVIKLIAGAVALLLLLALALVPLIKRVRRSRRRRTAGSWTGPFLHGWQEVLDTARDRGTPVVEPADRLAQARQLGLAVDLARRADAAVFSPVPATPEEQERFWDDTQAARRELLAGLTRLQRVGALFNPASLLAGWERNRSQRRDRSVQDSHEDRRTRGQRAALR